MIARQPRQASPKLLLAGAVLVVLAIAGVGLLSSGGGSATRRVEGAGETRALLDGIPQHGNVLGARAAPVTLVEYADLQCPYCRDFDVQTMPLLVRRYVRTRRLKVVFRPLAFIGPDSVRGRNAVVAAGLQGRLFDVMELLYQNQGTENTGWLDDRLVRSVGTAVPGVDVSRLVDESSSTTVAREAQRFDDAAIADGVRATPTLLVGKSGGGLRRVDEAGLKAAIDAAL
jgi:protein-disulfide isomerase